MRGVLRAALPVVVVLAAGACTSQQDRPTPEPHLRWSRVALPPSVDPSVLASGPDGSLLLATDGDETGSRPPTIVRLHGGDVSHLPVRPRSYYGRRTVWHGLATHGEVVYAVGGRSGGAHGNMRWTTWSGRSRLDEDVQTFETFGGPSAGGISGIAVTGSGDPVVAGSWFSTTVPGLDLAVWDLHGRTWVRRPSEHTALAADREHQPAAYAVTARGRGVLVAGLVTVLGHGAPRTRGAVWTTPGTGSPWRRLVLPDPEDGSGGPVVEARAAACQADQRCLVVGDADGRLVAWSVDPDLQVTRLDLPSVRVGSSPVHAALSGGDVGAVAATTPAGTTRVLFGRGGTWTEAAGPGGTAAGLEITVGRLCLLTREADGGRLWSARPPGLSARP